MASLTGKTQAAELQTERKKFFCPCCNIGHATSDDMINHIKESPIKVKTYNCQICLLEFFVKSDLIDHQRLDHQMAIHKKYKCDECELDYTNMSQLIRHKKMHDEIAKKLAASGIFLPRPGKRNTHCKTEEPAAGDSIPVVSSSPKHPAEQSVGPDVNSTLGGEAEQGRELRVKKDKPKTVELEAENDRDHSDSPMDAGCEDDKDSDSDYNVASVSIETRSVPRPKRVRTQGWNIETDRQGRQNVNLDSAELEGKKEGRKKRGRPRKKLLLRVSKSKKKVVVPRKRIPAGPESSKIIHSRTKVNRDEAQEVEIPTNLLNEDGSIRCPDCDVMCSSLNGLNRHRKFHFKTMDKLKCIFCETQFENRLQMSNHMTNVHPLKKCRKAYMLRPVTQQHPCTEPGCHEVFNASVSLTKHKTKVHGLDRFKVNSCEDCGKRFPSRSALTVHRRMHTDERPFKCDLCPKAYRASSSLVLHRKSHSDKKPFVCEYCGGGFTCPNSLRRHTRCRHTGEKPYMCDGCGATFTDHSQLAHHSKSHGHGKLASPGQYTCELCNKQFRTEFGIRSHKERCVHGSPGCDGNWKPKPVICEVCGREFPSKLNLKNHMVTHTDERPHKCRFCEATFRHYKSKYSHEKVHKGQKDFICNMCGKAFYQRINLKTHMTSHNDIKDLACRLCDKKFNSEHNRKRHEKRCMNYLKCPICSAIFRVHHRLVRHMNLNHQSTEAAGGEWLSSQLGQNSAITGHSGGGGGGGDGKAGMTDLGNRPTFVEMDNTCVSRPKMMEGNRLPIPPPPLPPPRFSTENGRQLDKEQYIVRNCGGDPLPLMAHTVDQFHKRADSVISLGPYRQQEESKPVSSVANGYIGRENNVLGSSMGRGAEQCYSGSSVDVLNISNHLNGYPLEQSRLIANGLAADVAREGFHSHHTTYLY